MPTPTTKGAIRVTNEQHQALMQAAFAQIHPPGDWKGEINCVVPLEIAVVYRQAIQFMTATYPEYSHCVGPNGQQLAHIRAAGYRNGPAGP